MEFRITALLFSRNMKVRDFKSKISCCFNSECDVIEVVCVYVQCHLISLINMSASYSRIGAFYVTLEVDLDLDLVVFIGVECFYLSREASRFARNFDLEKRHYG